MKKIYPIVLVFIFSFSYGQVVTVETARQVAKNIYFERANIEKNIAYQDIVFNSEFTITENNQPVFYVYNVEPSRGFVIISAEARTMPVLFYTFDGRYAPEFLNENFTCWLELYKKQINQVRLQHVKKHKEIEKFWNYYSSPSVALSKDIEAVSPLLTTNWGQDCYFNQYCPGAIFGPCGKCYAGCVADAMAMVMKYHNYPAHGYSSHSYAHTIANGFSNNFGTLTANFGTTTYNWASMPNNVTSPNTAVATLIYHCGVSVNMDYDDEGSGAYLTDATAALKNYFIYSAQYAMRTMYTDNDWTLLIKNSLDSLRPVIYGGNDAGMGGHAFVCDGYQNSGTYSNMFHFNWGWSGTSNGYIYLNNIAPDGTGYDFDDGQQIIYNIYPKPATTPVADFTANNTSVLVNGVVVFTNSSANDPIDYLWTIVPSSGASFAGGSSATSKNAIIRFTAPGYYSISLKATNAAGTDTETKNNYIYVYSTADVEENDPGKNIMIYPNPAQDIITLQTEEPVASGISLMIFDFSGKKVKEGFIGNNGSNDAKTIDLSDLQKGIYYISINTGNRIVTRKVILIK